MKVLKMDFIMYKIVLYQIIDILLDLVDRKS